MAWCQPVCHPGVAQSSKQRVVRHIQAMMCFNRLIAGNSCEFLSLVWRSCSELLAFDNACSYGLITMLHTGQMSRLIMTSKLSAVGCDFHEVHHAQWWLGRFIRWNLLISYGSSSHGGSLGRVGTLCARLFPMNPFMHHSCLRLASCTAPSNHSLYEAYTPKKVLVANGNC